MLTRPPRLMTASSGAASSPRTAWKRALRPAESTVSTEAPPSRSFRATSVLPADSACIKAVQPASSERLVFALAARSRDTPFMSPRFEASIRAVVPCSVCTSTSALCVASHDISWISPRRAAKCMAPTPLVSWELMSPPALWISDSKSSLAPPKTADRKGVKPLPSRRSGSAPALSRSAAMLPSPRRHATWRLVSLRALGMSTSTLPKEPTSIWATSRCPPCAAWCSAESP
mmetsp:Transcript_72418/g.130321  ORF Transcript_72418/g.130321 Transcript_72418/m.130321 type:complete len:231 (-) Transcript_72418:916-1608(-)